MLGESVQTLQRVEGGHNSHGKQQSWTALVDSMRMTAYHDQCDPPIRCVRTTRADHVADIVQQRFDPSLRIANKSIEQYSEDFSQRVFIQEPSNVS